MAASRRVDLAQRYLDATALAGAQVAVRTKSDEYVGRLLDLDVVTGLLVQTRAGEIRLDLAHVHAVDRRSL